MHWTRSPGAAAVQLMLVRRARAWSESLEGERHREAMRVICCGALAPPEGRLGLRHLCVLKRARPSRQMCMSPYHVSPNDYGRSQHCSEAPRAQSPSKQTKTATPSTAQLKVYGGVLGSKLGIPKSFGFSPFQYQSEAERSNLRSATKQIQSTKQKEFCMYGNCCNTSCSPCECMQMTSTTKLSCPPQGRGASSSFARRYAWHC